MAGMSQPRLGGGVVGGAGYTGGIHGKKVRAMDSFDTKSSMLLFDDGGHRTRGLDARFWHRHSDDGKHKLRWGGGPAGRARY
jgi:hypothetical protein